LESLLLLILNELSEEPHNAYIKCFASRIREKRAAFRILKGQNAGPLSGKLLWFLQGLWKHWFSKGGAPMRQEFDVSPFQYSAEEVLREAGYEK